MDALRQQLEQALAGSYVFERELGGGGMSRTYLVREKALDRRVVVKVLAPELLAGISVERFRREVLLAAQLQHPHVVPVLTAGDTGGLPWFTMPYVDGDSLRQRIAQGPIGTTEVIGILRDVARALAYAHGHGIVHRDIKPDNVLLSAGSATVTDFGIAKAINAARRDEGPGFRTELTIAGTSIGTPTYMAPEQAAGDPDTDHRADIYSFGAMAYELLAGRPPFHGLTPARLLAAHLGEKPQDVRALRPDCPEPLAALVMRCLEKEPSARPQQATEIAKVLDTITSSGAAAAAPAILAGGRIRFGKALALWATAAGLVSVTAWAATSVIGLPDWVFPGAVGTMLAGLPVIIATWYAQKVAHRAFTGTPTLTPGGTTASAVPQGTMATIAMKASPHLSWRRAWLGGGVAVGGFAVLVIAWMVMRAMGIGPAASLRGAGTFGAHETLVVADFASPAGDSTLGGTAAEALRTDLGQSRALRVISRASMRDVLRLMQRATDAGVPFDVAREIATREGAKAVLDGSIERLGQSFVISARLVGALDGAELATFRETADDEDHLLEALGALSRAVRDKAGESLRAIRASKDLERVTTPSLTALRKYVEGSLTADERGDADRGLALLQEAVTLDTAFAMAWRKISVLLGNEGRERTRALDAIERAYRHRDRLSELERLSAEAYYFTRGPRPDQARALAAYEQVIALDSLSTSALNNAAVIYTDQRRYAEAAALYKRVTELPRTFGGAFTNLQRVQIFTGDSLGTAETAKAFRERFPDSGDRWETEAYVLWARHDFDRLDSLGRAVFPTARTRRQAVRSADGVAMVAMARGQPNEAIAWGRRSIDADVKADPRPAGLIWYRLDSARVLAGAPERPAEARAVLARAFAQYPLASIEPSERPWRDLAWLSVELRDPTLAQQALEGFIRDQAQQAPDPEGRTAAYRAVLAFTQGRYDEAITQMRFADDRRMTSPRMATMLVARAHDLAGRPDSAIAAFTRVAETPDPDLEVAALYEAGIFKRLGELYEAKGDRANAIKWYERFVDRWARAEPALQPKVREVEARLDRLRPPR
ncbi:MAG: protein kinase [Gemmatimonadaceae bacterium]|nr:protein kinase [Gemmatimonadaceae bacterium]